MPGSFPAASLVRANTTNSPAVGALVMNRFEPSMTHSSPSRTALVLRPAGLEPAQAKALAGNVVDWRNPSSSASEIAAHRAAYTAAGRDYGPRNGSFASVEELQMVLGITPGLYRVLVPEITIWSGNQIPDPNTAPPLALAAIPGMTPEQASAIQDARLKNASDPSMVLGNGTTHSIQSEATLADGTRAVLRATIRMQAGQAGAQPYAVLRWQEGDAE